ncbi:Response regulator [Chitinispirillum alkaliphilum]|nr:Response regulator [Chitinispirillum alkaliphilum]
MFFDEELELYFASSGPEAIELLSEESVHVIVSDMRMPVMNGVEFLKKSIDLCPDAVRLVLSGQADIADIMDSINEGGIWRYISKPWNDNDMKLTIRNAVDLFNKNDERKQLLVALSEKNELLNSLNEQLEQKVKQRTRMIQSQNALLNMLVESCEMPEFIVAACDIISEVVNSKCVYIQTSFADNKTYSLSQTGDRRGVAEFLKKASASNSPLTVGIYKSFPLIKSEVRLGTVVFSVDFDKDEDLVTSVGDSIVPVLSLALSQFKMVLDAPNLLDDISNILDNI